MSSSHGKRRGGHAEGHVNHERWLLTYADLITLLVVFFIVMYSMSLTDVRKFQNVAGSLSKAFNNGVLTGTDGAGLTESGGKAVASMFLDAVEKKDFNAIVDTLGRVVRADNSDAAVDVTTSYDGIVISISGSTLFPSGRAELRPEGKTTLDAVIESISSIPNPIRIEGHTDDIAPTSSEYSSNFELSTARATSVLRYFLSRGVIAPNRLSVAGFGEFRPMVPNKDPQSRAKNRRADIVVLYGQAAAVSATAR